VSATALADAVEYFLEAAIALARTGRP
jgi:hypothetical protein